MKLPYTKCASLVALLLLLPAALSAQYQEETIEEQKFTPQLQPDAENMDGKAAGDGKTSSPPPATPVVPPPLPPEEPETPPNAASLMALNKVTARTSEILAPIGILTRFGNLEVIVKSCKKAPPDKRAENAALLEVWELKPEKKPEQIFSGWMFSSSPAISSLEHPVYDITVKACVNMALE